MECNTKLQQPYSAAVAGDDIDPVIGVHGFLRAFKLESRKLWSLAGPAILTSVCQYSLNAVTQTFAGHIGTFELATFSVENSIISGLCYGIMFAMFSKGEGPAVCTSGDGMRFTRWRRKTVMCSTTVSGCVQGR
ncbi:hypothetical protein ABFS82_11G059500 [Erythranthe guttata]